MVSSKTIDEIDGIKEKDNMKVLEAILFISGRFLTIQELISLSDLNPLIIKDLITKESNKVISFIVILFL